MTRRAAPRPALFHSQLCVALRLSADNYGCWYTYNWKRRERPRRAPRASLHRDANMWKARGAAQGRGTAMQDPRSSRGKLAQPRGFKKTLDNRSPWHGQRVLLLEMPGTALVFEFDA